MSIIKLILILLFTPLSFFAQKQDVEVSEKIFGKSKDKIYLFFENDLFNGDSISTKVINGKFNFKLSTVLPVLCRIHFFENSQIQEFYIDQIKTTLTLSSRLTDRDIPDSLGGPKTFFEITTVKGSATQDLISSFADWKSGLEKKRISASQKQALFYEKVKTIVTKYPKSKASAYLIAGGIYFRGSSFSIGDDFPLSYAEITTLSGILDSSLATTMEWANLSNMLMKLDLKRNRVTGNAFNDVTLPDTNGIFIATKNFRNKFVLIDFWASWCKPCRAMNPEMKVLLEKYRDKGFEIIGISIDSDENSWKTAIIQDELTWTNLYQGVKGTLSTYYDIEYIPTKILLNKEGIVVGFNLSTKEIDTILATKL